MIPPKGPLPTAEEIGKLVPIGRIAKDTPYSTDFLRQLARSGKLRAYKLHRDWLTTPEAVHSYLKSQTKRHEKALSLLQAAEKAFLALALIVIVFSVAPRASAQNFSNAPPPKQPFAINNPDTRSQSFPLDSKFSISVILHDLRSSWETFGRFYGQQLSAIFDINKSALAEQGSQIHNALLSPSGQVDDALASLGQALLGKTTEEYLADAPVPILAMTKQVSRHQGAPLPTGLSPVSYQPEVLGVSTSLIASNGNPATSLVNQGQLQTLINQTLARSLTSGQFMGQQGVPGPQGPPGPSSPGLAQNGYGQTTAVVGGTPIVTYYPSQPENNFSGSSVAGFTQLSSQALSAQTADIQGALNAGGANISGDASILGSLSAGATNIASLTVSGNVNLTGSTTIAGLNVTGFNPGLMPGSVAFQSSSALGQDNSNFFYDSTSHRLGLGTTTPAQLLSVAGNMRLTGALFDSGNASGTSGMLLETTGTGTKWVATSTLGFSAAASASGTPGNIQFAGAGSTLNSTSLFTWDNSLNRLAIGSSSLSSTLALQGAPGPAPLLTIASSTGANLFTVLANGYVGIGSANPLRNLDVVGSNSTSTLSTNSGAAIGITNTDTTNNNFADLTFLTDDVSGSSLFGAKISAVFTSHAAGSISSDLAFLTRNAGVTSEKLRITALGNVGIGTSSPSSLLVVNGTAQILGAITLATTTVTSFNTQVQNGCYNTDTFSTIQGAITAAGTTGCVNITPPTTDLTKWYNPNGLTVVDQRPTTRIGQFLGGASVKGSLSNFFNGNVATKKVVVLGNSTVSNATSWFSTMNTQATISGGIFGGMDVHSDVATVTADSVGNVTVGLNSSSADIIVGQYVTLTTQTGATQCFGSGIVSSTSTNSFIFNIANDVSCLNVSATASTGYVTQQILNFGNNGASLAAILANTSATSTGVGGVCAAKPDLLIIRGPLINDVRLGLTTKAQATALERQLLDTIRACSPNTDIYLKTENPLLTTDVGSHGYVSPNSSAAAYSAILEAVPMSFTNVYPNVVTFDTQQVLYGTAALDSSVAPYMTDQLHPSVVGQVAEAKLDMQELTILKNNGSQVVGNADPNSSTTLVPFSPFLASDARANNYSQPWATNASSSGAMYPYSCADPNYYTLVASGNATAFPAGQTFFRFSWNGTIAPPVQGFDVVEQQTAGCWQLNSSPAAINSSNGIAQVSLGGGQTTPYAMVLNEQVNIYRPKYPSAAAEGYLRNPTVYPYSHQAYVIAAGSGFFDIAFAKSEGLNTKYSAIGTSDQLLLNNTTTPLALSGCSFVASGNNLRCLATGDYTTLLGQFGSVVGTHPIEGKPDSSGNVVVTGNLGVGYRLGATSSPLTISSSTGATLFTVLQNGTVGIGTSTTAARLSVTGTSAVDPFDISSTSGASLVRVTQAGNVGIGTTTPTLGPLTMASGAYVTAGGVWTNASDRNLKENFASVSPATILQDIDELPVTEWDYKTEGPSIKHVGPVAQDFAAIFHLGNNNTSISTIDPAGVALLGIQGLDQKITALQGSLTGNATATNLGVYSPANFSGDSVGEAKILSGQTSVRVTFTQAYQYQPIITLTPEDQTASGEFVTDRNSTGFTIRTPLPVICDTTFAWHSFASPAEQLTVSDGSTQLIQLTVVQPPADSQPANALPVVSAATVDTVASTDVSASSTPDPTGSTTTASVSASSTPQVLDASTTTPASSTSSPSNSNPQQDATPTPVPTPTPTPVVPTPRPTLTASQAEVSVPSPVATTPSETASSTAPTDAPTP